jgi:DNA-binding Xre family transcriptional regulator
MVVCRLDALMAERGVTASQLQRGTGISAQTIRKLRYMPLVSMDLEVLDKLAVFFNCEPGALLEREP